MTNPLKQLQSKIGYQFKNPELLTLALTHRSYLNENRNQNLASNERLEFLGDAVLELWVSKKLFRLFPDYSEGNLTNLRAMIVCTTNLFQIADSFNLGDYILLSRGEISHGGRSNQSILADTFESLAGAIYIDGGAKPAYSFLNSQLNANIKENSEQKIYKDPKSLFQEIAQEKEGITPHYQTVKETGPDHQKIFEVTVYVGDKEIAVGTGPSKQKAEEAAAINAVKTYQGKD